MNRTPDGYLVSPPPASRRSLLALLPTVAAALLALLTFYGCGPASGVTGGMDDGGGSGASSSPSSTSGPRSSPGASPGSTVSPDPSIAIEDQLCERTTVVLGRLADLQSLQLRPTAKVSLDIELGHVQAAFSELRQSELGPAEVELETPLRRLGYRLDELELAVEDFRTNPRPRAAANHVAEEAGDLADALAGFFLLARC